MLRAFDGGWRWMLGTDEGGSALTVSFVMLVALGFVGLVCLLFPEEAMGFLRRRLRVGGRLGSITAVWIRVFGSVLLGVVGGPLLWHLLLLTRGP